MLNEEKSYLMVGPWKMDLEKNSPRHVVSTILHFLLDPAQGSEAVRADAKDLIDLFQEIRTFTRDLKTGKEWSQLCVLMIRSLKNMIRIRNEVVLLSARYDQILRLERLSTLPGFGIQGSIEKGLLGYNPERRSTMRTY
jgi:hypothetical protein